MNDDERWRACVHEGHAVGARLLGVPSGSVCLKPWPHADFSHQGGAASICAIMAGGAAERLVFGDFIGIVTDKRNAAAIMDELGVDDGGAALWAWTCAFLALHLGLIFRVANVLWDLKALDGDEIDALLASRLRTNIEHLNRGIVDENSSAESITFRLEGSCGEQLSPWNLMQFARHSFIPALASTFDPRASP